MIAASVVLPFHTLTRAAHWPAGGRSVNRDYGLIEYRELRRSDIPSFEGVMRQGLGELERATGLDRLSEEQAGYLQRRTVWTLFSVTRRLGLAPIGIYVGADKGRVLGTASVVLLPNAGYVMGVATDLESRGHGIATALLEVIHAVIRRKGRPWSALDVESDNETAIRVYKRLRYEEKARYGWYVGTAPDASGTPARQATEVGDARMKEAAAWVDRNRPSSVREPLPATRQRLSHFEVVTRMSGAPAKTWNLASSGRIEGVVRASYLPTIQVGYVIPSAWDPSLPEESMLSLLDMPMRWIRGLGANRVVVIVPDPAGPWERTVLGYGLRKAVSSTLMTRPSTL